MSGMPNDPLEVFAAWRVAPLRPIERPDTLADEIGNPVFVLSSVFIQDTNVPDHVFIIPGAGLDQAFKLSALVEPVLMGEVSIVSLNFCPLRVEMRPICTSQPKFLKIKPQRGISRSLLLLM